ncbi:TetR family transcriptional regulator [Agromyces endophyticus]|uniref:TetR family transcriptional regulator n=1 Tax=Agromyces sp. H17E-10 TaxID=2932244 RepID=UPI001FCFAE5C|nr:TetR family transcriptional regulator [Agromyces sp. H17E-10]UOQ90818.1 TetR family transcriptional regulator [Agromyces sp. H17E-10]
MGNREDLLEGARRVILERGVAKATARDIAAAAGVSLAAIGYHFGSKDQLITEALTESLGSGIGDRIDEVIRETTALPLLGGFAALFNRMPEVFADNREALIASLENTVRVLRGPGGGHDLAAASNEAVRGIAEHLRASRPELDDEQVEAVAKLEFTLVQSLGILWLVDPSLVPTGDELALAVAAIAAPPAG